MASAGWASTWTRRRRSRRLAPLEPGALAEKPVSAENCEVEAAVGEDAVGSRRLHQHGFFAGQRFADGDVAGARHADRARDRRLEGAIADVAGEMDEVGAVFRFRYPRGRDRRIAGADERSFSGDDSPADFTAGGADRFPRGAGRTAFPAFAFFPAIALFSPRPGGPFGTGNYLSPVCALGGESAGFLQRPRRALL